MTSADGSTAWVSGRVIGSWWSVVSRSVGSSVVVAEHLAVQHWVEVTLVDDEQPAGELSSNSADKPFRVTVGLWTPRRDLHNVDTR